MYFANDVHIFSVEEQLQAVVVKYYVVSIYLILNSCGLSMEQTLAADSKIYFSKINFSEIKY